MTRPAPRIAPRRKRHVGRVIGIIVLILVVLLVGMWFYVDSTLKRTDALSDYSGRPVAGAGTNWLMVGSDSREDLTEAQKQQLATGDASGARTDTIMLLHIPSSGKPTLVSLLRDSYVDIPGHGKNKINAAYAFGGAPLLVHTVEGATGLHVDHFMEVGFGGFANVVDAIGGVNICVDQPIDDPKAGINLQAGCQDLNGSQALGYVRTRATPSADLDRVVHQRQFLHALLSKVTSPGVTLNPFKAFPLLTDLPSAVTVSQGDHLYNLIGLALAMANNDLVTTTVPMAGTENTSVGNVVLWDKNKASELFTAFKNDQPVPADVLTGSN